MEFLCRQTGNDKWFIEEIFKNKYNGFFIEAGCLNIGDDTFLLEKEFGWAGICVEPINLMFKLLTKKRKCFCENSVLYEKSDESIEFVNVLDKKGYSGIKRFMTKDHLDIIKDYEIELKSTISLIDLIKKYNAPNIIDLLCLDTEGSEFSILKDFPFDQYRFKCITIEGSSCNELLASKGYIKVKNPFSKAPWENCFLNKDFFLCQ